MDLNCDLGEGYPNDAALMPLITSANVACGGHAGDHDTMRDTVLLALRHGVSIGAHPSYPDREHFGRKKLELPRLELLESLLAQMRALESICSRHCATIRHMKPHGALYNVAVEDRDTARIIVEAVLEWGCKGALIFTLPFGYLKEEAEKNGFFVVGEAFADRSYRDDGTLTPRNEPGALITDVRQSVEQARHIALHGRVVAASGHVIDVQAGSICLHGDGDHAVEFAQAIHDAFMAQGIVPKSP